MRHAPGVLYLLLFALALRALIPLGYMPDAGALRDGRIQIVLCTAAGVSTMPAAMDPLAQDQPATDKATSGTDCAFSLLSQQAQALPASATAPALWVVLFSSPAPVADNTTLPAAGTQGPPLGSRAPPSVLG
ncbi:MAG TPA: DUF2946 family protein [Burkholderiaceae bacterium]|nr:DUF2946 family protein [Burkholderiaceae bacterium]